MDEVRVLPVDKERKMEDIRARFAEGSTSYDGRITRIIPRYSEMLDALISSVMPRWNRMPRVLDIGCGTGALSAAVLRSRPEAELTCLDMTKEMLDIARQRLSGHDNVGYVVADIHDFQLDGPYDAVVSSLALHHIGSDEEKKAIYRKVFDALRSGGCFYNADLVLASNDDLQEVYMAKWKEFMYRSFSHEEVDHAHITRYRQEDSPAKLVDHLRWMGDVGFRDLDVVWKYYNFAVYGGTK
ncbi:MAG: methyltransferase domain-containing protein [Methanomassiliicoccus sp.]|nr:methyltransferase domain-containing protein [Methanomassiliicoccus sp.]